jgi:small subunit ribosomal protein S15
MLLTEQKQEVVKNFGRHEKDTGSPEVQIVLLTKRIDALSEHFKNFKKDTNSRRGFLKLIGQRRKLLKYLQIEDPARYQEIVKKLNLRK